MKAQLKKESNHHQGQGIPAIFPPGPEHWVGNGFLVRSAFQPDQNAHLVSPFLLLDHAARRHFDRTLEQRGVGEHPHRGFETVTFAFAGEIAHRDSSGGGGLIGPGDVQWMTAASGLVHEEFHSRNFSMKGGEFEMVQLWVNLPAAKKMIAPRYQSLLDQDFPRIKATAVEARLIAGSLAGEVGPAQTQTPITIADLIFVGHGHIELELPARWTILVYVLEGDIAVGEALHQVPSRNLCLLTPRHDGPIRLQGTKGSHVLLLGGEPLNEPVVHHGPFVMNTQEEIIIAMRDYQTGKMGRLLNR